MESEVQVGQLIAGKYRVQQVLGRGGMGVVMAALHEHLNQRVALKFLLDNAYQQPEAVARFVREARSAVQIQSEHVARVMDVGTLDSGAPYMVMEYLRGRDLKEVSARRGPLPVSEAVDFVLQACDAVAEAHSLGIVHRDLKPSNLFLTERPDGSPLVKVLDFGISKALHNTEPNQLQMTASAAIMGSPQYMSPEQIRSSKNVDARADIWALGTILHELLTGVPAYVADTVPGLLAMIVADAPPSLCAFRPDAPAELEAAILRCLQKDRDQRFANLSEFARAIERFASAETRPLVRRIARVLGADAAPISEAAGPAPQGMTVREHSGQTNGTWTRTGRVSEGGSARPRVYQKLSAQLGIGLGIIALGALGWFAFASRPGDAESLDRRPAASPVTPSPEPAAVQAPATPARGDQRAAPGITSGPAVGVVHPVPDDPALPANAEEDPASGARVGGLAADTVESPTPAKAKKAGASPIRKERPRPASAKPRSPSPESARDATDSTSAQKKQSPVTAPAKKTNTYDDLFNDTK